MVRLCSRLFFFGVLGAVSAVLAGCAAPATQPVASAPNAAPAADVLRQAEEAAYKEGVEEGRREQWWHDHKAASAAASKPAASATVTVALPAPAGTAMAATAAEPTSPATTVQAAPAQPVPPGPGQSVYDPSGPATPVGKASDPF